MRRDFAIYFILIAIIMLYCIRVEAANCETDFKKASSVANASGKYILLDFSGSDWCGWCIKLEKEVFSQDVFKNFARKNLVMCVSGFSPENRADEGAETAKLEFGSEIRN